MNTPARHRIGLSSFMLLVMAGCTTAHYRKSADRETYQIIKEKTPVVQNMDEHFTIKQTNSISLDRYPISTNVEGFMGSDGKRESGARILRLRDALDIAVQHSRSYQTRKEQLYLSALSLTLTRHDFQPIFSGSAEGTYAEDLTDHMAETHTVDGNGTIGVSWLIRDLGRITTAFTTDFLRFLAGDPRSVASSQIGATFARPLLRDAGFKQDMETLTQGERQLLYDLRDFAQYRKDFTVQIATAYYGVLGRRDAIRNSYLNLQSSRKNAERTRAMVAEGRNTTAELGRLEQQVLTAESSWISAIRSYKQALDDFKFQLGLSIESNIVLDDHELETLQIHHPSISVEDSIRIALAGRLDFKNVEDQFEDAERHVKLAANLLKPGLNLSASFTAYSNPDESGRFTLPELDRYNWNAGLAFDPGLDRKAERNSYRTALIALNRAARAVDQQEDQIKLEVRDSWRTLDEAERNYEISEIGVKLSERRVEEQDLLAEVGRAKAQDQVDAQNALIDAKNQRTQALVTHTIARLQFWNNLGILYIKDNGQWKEIQDEKAN